MKKLLAGLLTLCSMGALAAPGEAPPHIEVTKRGVALGSGQETAYIMKSSIVALLPYGYNGEYFCQIVTVRSLDDGQSSIFNGPIGLLVNETCPEVLELINQ